MRGELARELRVQPAWIEPGADRHGHEGHARPAIGIGNRDAVYDRVGDAITRGEGVGGLLCRDVLALPPIGVTETRDEVQVAVA